MLDIRTITIKQNVMFQGRLQPEIFCLEQIKIAAYQPLLAPAVTVSETEGAMDSASVFSCLFFCL